MKTTITLAAGLLVASVATAQSFNFDAAVTTGTTQAPGVWYTDRYAPAGFTSPAFFDGDNRLKQSISSADSEANRPGSFSSAFYNTQGRKYDLDAGMTSLSIDLYVSADWATSGRRMAGLWGTAFDSTNAVSFFPIIEFTSDSNDARFRTYNNGVWVDLGLPTAFAYNTWTTLTMSIVGSDWVVSAGDQSTTFSALGSSYIGNAILQGHNTAAGVDYDIYWDNMKADTQAVPEPMTMVVLAGLAGLAARRKRK